MIKNLAKKYGLKRKGGKHKGFTLIELLIVLTILAILVAVVTISLTQFVGTGEEQACKTDARTLSTSVVAFHSQAGGWPTVDGDSKNGGDGVIVYTAQYDDDTPLDGIDAGDPMFAPDFVTETPQSQAGCVWSLDSGRVYANPAGPLPADKDEQCPCWETYPVPAA